MNDFVRRLIELRTFLESKPLEMFIVESQTHLFDKNSEIIFKIIQLLISNNNLIVKFFNTTALEETIDAYTNLLNTVKYESVIMDSNILFNRYIEVNDAFINQSNRLLPLLIINDINLNDIKSRRGDIEELYHTAMTKTTGIDSIVISSELKLKAIEELYNKAEFAEQRVVAAKFGLEYDKAAIQHKVNSRIWLLLLILCATIIAGMAYNLIIIAEENFKVNSFFFASNNTLALFVSLRVIMFTILFYGLNFCNKNYRANKHNELLNKHRQKSLNTFETFVKSTSSDDVQIRDSILMAVTNTIFTNQPTGYSFNDKSDDGNRFAEIINNFQTKKD